MECSREEQLRRLRELEAEAIRREQAALEAEEAETERGDAGKEGDRET